MEWRIGCCGFSKGRAAYFEAFDLVEIQQTFYKLPGPTLAPKWRAESPTRFEFVLKAPQLITHLPSSPTYRRLGEEIPLSKRGAYGFFRPTAPVKAARARIEKMAKELKSRLLLYQCPASFKPTAENLRNLGNFFRRKSPARCALEFRGPAWESERISDLCSELAVIPVVDPLVHPPLFRKEVAYFRLHGLPELNYRYEYKPRELMRLHGRLADLPVKTCYVLFNNFTMFSDAIKFKALCGLAGNRRDLPATSAI